jgi:hypothetical protein
VQTVGSVRGEVLERFSTQFVFDDPDLIVTTACGVIAQQGRPFTHAFEIYFEKATLLFDFAAIAGGPNALTPLTVLSDNGKATRPKLGAGDPTAAFVAELTEAVRAVRSGAASPILDARLACDAVWLCRKQTESALRHRPVKV